MAPQNQEWRNALPCEDLDARKRLLDIALDARKQELQFLWQRSSFFWLFTAAALPVFIAVKEDRPLLATAVSCFGFMASCSWTFLNRGSKYWYESWEEKIDVDLRLKSWFIPAKLSLKDKSVWLAGRRFSPSKLMIGVSDYVTLFWLGVLFFQLFDNLVPESEGRRVIVHYSPSILVLATIIYALFLIASSAYENVLGDWVKHLCDELSNQTKEGFGKLILAVSSAIIAPILILLFAMILPVVVILKTMAKCLCSKK